MWFFIVTLITKACAKGQISTIVKFGGLSLDNI
jgi:hypothetical protein